MTSKKLRRLAVDANPILSALIHGRAHKILSSPDFFTTEHTVREVIAHVPEMVEKANKRGVRIQQADLYFALVVAPLQVCSQDFYQEKLEAARQRIEKRDPEDVDLLALAIKLSVPVWTNDQDYATSGVRIFTTSQLLKKLGMED